MSAKARKSHQRLRIRSSSKFTEAIVEAYTDLSSQDFSDSNLLPSQYNDVIRRPSSVAAGEYRLLWGVLEDALRLYMGNMDCSTPRRRLQFEEVREWFQAEDKNCCVLVFSASSRTIRSLESALARSYSIVSRSDRARSLKSGV
jgi:hypothetical protein